MAGLRPIVGLALVELLQDQPRDHAGQRAPCLRRKVQPWRRADHDAGPVASETDPFAAACATDRTWSGSAVPVSGMLLSSLTWASPDSGRERLVMRRKPGHSMTSNTPSTHRSEGSPGLRAPPCRRMGWRKASLGPRKPRGRTSRPAPPAPDPHWTRSVCSGRQCHLPCRSPHGHKPEGRTTDAIGKAVRENRSRGCSQTSLYNTNRPHTSLNGLTPTEFATRPDKGQNQNERSL